jgi:hypothetical protein
LYQQVQTTKTNKMTTNEKVSTLQEQQKEEHANGFQNGELWNDLQDKIYCLQTYGQENQPKEFKENGFVSGYELNNGDKVYYSGMTFETID